MFGSWRSSRSLTPAESLRRIGKRHEFEWLILEDALMSNLAMELDEKLKRWDSSTCQQVESLVSQIIELADHDSLDLLRSRSVEQEVLDLLDDAPTQTR